MARNSSTSCCKSESCNWSSGQHRQSCAGAAIAGRSHCEGKSASSLWTRLVGGMGSPARRGLPGTAGDVPSVSEITGRGDAGARLVGVRSNRVGELCTTSWRTLCGGTGKGGRLSAGNGRCTWACERQEKQDPSRHDRQEQIGQETWRQSPQGREFSGGESSHAWPWLSSPKESGPPVHSESTTMSSLSNAMICSGVTASWTEPGKWSAWVLWPRHCKGSLTRPSEGAPTSWPKKAAKASMTATAPGRDSQTAN